MLTVHRARGFCSNVGWLLLLLLLENSNRIRTHSFMLMKKRGGFPRSLSLFLVGILEGDGLGARSRRESTTANRQCHGMIWSLLFTKDVATMDDGRQKGAPQEQSEQPPPQPRRGLFSWPFVVSPTNSLSA